jgi:membrane fusion protein (multidrug efflux system)
VSEAALEREAVAGTDAGKSKVPFRRLLLTAAASAGIAAAAWYGYSWWTVGRFVETTDDAYVGGNITPLSPQVSGFISEILVTDNQRVGVGELLIRLDGRVYQAALDRAEANVRQQEATLQNLKSKIALQHSAIRQAEASLQGKIAEAQFAAEEAERYKALASTDAGSRQNAQKTFATNISAKAAVESARAALEASKQQLAVLDTEIAQTMAALAGAKADVETGRLNVGYTEIRSPIEGIVGNRAAQIGAFISAGKYLITIIPARGLWVDANFKEDQLGRMKPGQPAMIVADIFPGRSFVGHVGSLAPATGAIFSVIPPENATGNFTKIVQRLPVRIELDAETAGASGLRPGLSVTASVDTKSAEEGAR